MNKTSCAGLLGAPIETNMYKEIFLYLYIYIHKCINVNV